MGDPRRIDIEAIKQVLMTDEGSIGVFERALGFRASTGSIKGVHLMNDLAQSALGGAPDHGGDFLCRVIRLDIDGEDHRESTLRADARFGAAFNRAYPAPLGKERIEGLRRAARLVLNFDRGCYQPGTQMASALATHRDLLGFEGFRRFHVGRYLMAALPEDGRALLRRLFEDDGDPITRAFRPLLLPGPLVDKQPAATPTERTTYDEAFGRCLATLLGQPLSKPALLRALVLGASLGLVLKIFGAGRAGGRPVLLALAAQQEESGPKRLRDEAVASFRRGQEALDRLFVSLIPQHPAAAALLRKPSASAVCVEVPDARRVETVAPALVSAARRLNSENAKIYWPDEFAVALGRKAGCVLPLSNQAGWGRHLALTPDLVEVLVLMHVPFGAPPTPWQGLWRKVREDLGVVVGAEPTADTEFLSAAGVENVSVERLSDNAKALLRQAVRRSVARLLPDGGAEAGGELS